MGIANLVIDRVNSTGWLALSTLCFEEGHTIDVFASRGYIAYSAGKNAFLTLRAIDTTNTALVENDYVQIVGGTPHTGQQHTVAAYDVNRMVQFELAMYAQRRFFTDEQEVMPYPVLPTKAQIMAYTKDDETGLYTGSDTVGKISGREISTVGLYNHCDQIEDLYSGAMIESWQRFYKNQDKFIAMLSTCFGISDAV